jgi:hypothetical protein
VPPLCDQVDGLDNHLSECRRQHQNLEAAALATLAAHAEGEQDPLFYLRDELGVHGRWPDGEGQPW